VSQRRAASIYLVIAAVLLGAGCAGKITPQQAAVEEAFEACRGQGPSAKLDKVERDGRFSVVGRESEAQRVHDCMVRQAEPPRREPAGAAPTQVAKGGPLVASRLPGTWRGTLKLPPRTGQAEVAAPATVRFSVAAGALRWSLATGTPATPLAADGTAVVVDGELRMAGTMRAAGRDGEPARSGVSVRYAGAMVGDRLEVTGITTDKQVHVLTVRRAAE
jgi:hypothetical protein